MATIFDLDDEFDFEDDEITFSDEDFETNEYIKNEQKAIELVSKIVSCEKRNIANSNRLKKIDDLLVFHP